MKQFFHLLMLFRPFWGWAVLGVMLSTVTMLANITLLATSAWFITAMGVAGLAGVTMNYFTPAAIIRGCAIVRTAGRYLERLVSHEATFRFLGELRVRIFSNFAHTPLEVIERTHSTDLSSRVQYDIESLQGFYVRVIVPVAASFFTAILCLLYLLRFEVSLLLAIGTGMVTGGVIVPILAYRAIAKNAQDMSITAKSLKEHSVDMLDGLGELTVFHGIKSARAAFSEEISKRTAILALDETVALLAKNVLWLISQLTFIATIILAAGLLRDHQLSQANFVMVSMFAVACFESIAQVAPALMQLPQNKAAADRIFAFTPTSAPETSGAHLNNTDLRVESIAFSYDPENTKPICFDFSLPAGHKVWVKGPSGIGKSTLIDLILAQRTPQSGSITLGTTPVSELSEQTLVKTFSVSPQNTHIFTGSVRENLTLGNPDSTPAEIQNALHICKLTSLIDQLPDGLDTYLGEQGHNLSGGQIRRLGVARALLKPASILILDEPTEGLDPKTADQMMSNIINALNGRSLIVISHHPIHENMDTITVA